MPFFAGTFPVIAGSVLALSLGDAGGSTRSPSSARSAGDQAGEARPQPDAPAALVDGRSVSWGDLQPALAEAAGALVLGEVVLDTALEARASAAGIVITPDAIERERSLLLASMTPAGGSADDAVRALARVRAERGLGPVRYAALLRRTALLRALVAPTISVSPEVLDEAFAIRYGEQVLVRMIVTASEREASDALQAVGADRDPPTGAVPGGEAPGVQTPESDAQRREGGSLRAMRFASVAAKVSTDASRSSGGLLEPFSPRDTRYPAALRALVARLSVGEIGGPIALVASSDAGARTSFGVVYLEERRPAQAVTLESVRASLEAELRAGLERRAMDRLADEVLRAVPVSVMDRGLGWGWERRRGGPGAGGGLSEPGAAGAR